MSSKALIAQAKELAAVENMSDAQRAVLKDLVQRIEAAKAVEAAVAAVSGPAPDETGMTSDFQKTVADLAGFKFAAKDVENLRASAMGGTPYGMKAVQAETAFAVADGNFFDLERFPAVRAKFRVASLIPAKMSVGDGNGITYYRPSTLATGATAVAEGGSIPQSSPTFVAVSEAIRKMGHYAHVPGEALQDQADFVQVLAEELVGGLIAVENAQVLVGSGAGANLAGIFDDSRTAIQARAQGTDTVLDAVMKALDDVRTNGHAEPDSIVMRSSDWTSIRLAKNASDDYYFSAGGSPTGGSARSIDGVPVYLTEDGTASTVYVGAFSTARIYVRQVPTVETTISDGTDFLTDAVKARALERFALATPNEAAFCALTLA